MARIRLRRHTPVTAPTPPCGTPEAEAQPQVDTGPQVCGTCKHWFEQGQTCLQRRYWEAKADYSCRAWDIRKG